MQEKAKVSRISSEVEEIQDKESESSSSEDEFHKVILAHAHKVAKHVNMKGT